MDPELLSRIQFALTVSFHFIYPPISMGLGLLMVFMGWRYVRTKDPLWRQASFFWVKIYGLVFAMGIATGIVQEFEFGTNWAVYSRFVGNVFGSLLAAEGIFAFMLEGGFLGLLLFGGSRLGPADVAGRHVRWSSSARTSARSGSSWRTRGCRRRRATRSRRPSGATTPSSTDFSAGAVHAVVPAAPPPHLGGLVDGRRRARHERQRVVPAQGPPPGARAQEPDPRRLGVRRPRGPPGGGVRRQHGDRGDRTTSR